MLLKPPFNSIAAWLIDMDGVIYVGSQVLPGAVQFIQTLQANDHLFLFLTNNATKTPEQSVQRLIGMGIDVPARTIFNSAMATAAYMKQNYPPPKRVLVLGGHGIQVALTEAGYELAVSVFKGQRRIHL